MESYHYNKFKTLLEVCNISGINCIIMYLASVDIDIKTIHASGEIIKEGTYKDRIYFVLDIDERKLLDDHTMEICLTM